MRLKKKSGSCQEFGENFASMPQRVYRAPNVQKHVCRPYIGCSPILEVFSRVERASVSCDLSSGSSNPFPALSSWERPQHHDFDSFFNAYRSRRPYKYTLYVSPVCEPNRTRIVASAGGLFSVVARSGTPGANPPHPSY